MFTEKAGKQKLSFERLSVRQFDDIQNEIRVTVDKRWQIINFGDERCKKLCDISI